MTGYPAWLGCNCILNPTYIRAMHHQFPELPLRMDYVDAVYQVLLDAISAGSLPAGTRITQEEIAEQWKVSRSPVVHALRLLKKDGLVEDAPGRGVQVAPLSVDWVGKVYEVRAALDALAARLAARRRAVIDPALIAAGRRTSNGSDVRAMIDADAAFHRAIYAASGNPLIEDSARLHWVNLRRVMGAVLQVSGQRRSIWDEHEAIAAAIAAGDESGAAALISGHCASARSRLEQRFSAVLSTAAPTP